MTRARISDKLGIWVVSEEKAKENLRICETNACEHYDTLENGEPVCHACNCRGKDLIHKTRQSHEKCPIGSWSNRDG